MVSIMHQEIAQASDVLARQNLIIAPRVREVASILQRRQPPIIVTCARGSSDHAASFAKTIFESRLGTLVASYAPSMSSVYETYFRSLDNAVFIAISQSGKSPDILSSLIGANEAGALTIAIVNDENSPAAGLADVVLPICAGTEISVAATKTFIATMGVLVSLLAEWQNDNELRYAYEQSPEAIKNALSLDWDIALESLTKANNMFVLGRSLTYGIAGEAALKLKETCALHAEAYSAAEVQHGPMALIKENFPVLLFPPFDKARQGIMPLIKEFSQRGANVFAVGNDFDGAVALSEVSGLHPLISPMAQITSFYNFAEKLAHLRGYNPDNPQFLKKVTQTI